MKEINLLTKIKETFVLLYTQDTYVIQKYYFAALMRNISPTTKSFDKLISHFFIIKLVKLFRKNSFHGI